MVEPQVERSVFRIRSELRGEHVADTVFAGIEGQTLANCGTLMFRVGEWQMFGMLLKLASELTQKAAPGVLVLLEGDDKVVEQLAAKEAKADGNQGDD